MKTRISFKKLLKLYSSVISILVGVETFVLIFIDIPDNEKGMAAIINIIIFIVVLFFVFIISSLMTKRCLKLCGTNVIVKFGDIFEETGSKVIGFNEYFDTLVDEVLISSHSLNGQVISKYIDDISELDEKISKDSGCKVNIVETNDNKILGKTTKYKLGTCFKYNDYIFVAFTKFDEQNRAYLDMPNYMFCLANFWKELNRVYNGENVVIPLMGSGITRISNSYITKQDQLEILIDSLKYSGLSFTHEATISIVLPKSMKEEIKLFNLK